MRKQLEDGREKNECGRQVRESRSVFKTGGKADEHGKQMRKQMNTEDKLEN